ncbi:MAG: winged helix-turn-helix domain-containing protein [Proteobacteria bacterium]|nr:winged helix-turn-helix domain-containing protein [Pseudomonadota bacterium]
MKKVYNFLDFQLDANRHVLYKANKRIALGSIAYKILLYFVQNPGINVDRNILIEYIWQDKFITDATLYKQIQRLRKSLGDSNENKRIISTIHSVGFMFLPEVSVTEINLPSIKPKKNKKILFGLAVIAILAFIFSTYESERQVVNLPLVSEAEAMPTKLAVIPDLLNDMGNMENQLWMLNGGVHYLYEQLSHSFNVIIKPYTRKQLDDTDPDRFAIDITNKEKLDASILLQISERNGRFHSEVKIRNENGMFAQEKFSADSIKSLLDDISSWSKQSLNLTPKDNTTRQVMSKNRYAVENYIRGMSAQLTGDAQKAIKYFELATVEDKQFWLAWYELTHSFRKQGNYSKALSIIETLDKITLSEELSLKLINSKVTILYRLGEHHQALEIADYGIALAKDAGNNKIWSSLLTNKAFIVADLGDLELAKQTISLSIGLLEKRTDEKSSSMGTAYNTLSGIEIRQNDFKSAKTHSQMSIDFFIKAGDIRYTATAQSRMAFILFQLGELDAAEKLYLRVLEIQQGLKNPSGQIGSLYGLIQIQMIKGDYTSATVTNNTILELINTSTNKRMQAGYIATRAKLMLLTNQTEIAKNLIDQLKDQDFHKHDLIYHQLLLQYYQQTKLNSKWESVAKQLINDHSSNESPFVYGLQAKLALKNGKYELAINAFEEAMVLALKEQSSIEIANTLNPYIDFMLEQDISKAEQLLNTLELNNPPSYPFLKNKAKLHYHKGGFLFASTLLLELKNKSGGLWTVDDQLLLESYQSRIQP